MRKKYVLLIFFILTYIVTWTKTYAYENEPLNFLYCLNNSNLAEESNETDVKVKSIDIDSDLVIPNNKDIIVPSNTERITFNIEVLKKANNVSVLYYLDGFDRTSRDIVEESASVSYANLEGGNYNFHIIITDNNGEVINEQVIKLHKKLKFSDYNISKIITIVIAAILIIAFYRKSLNEHTRKLNEQHQRYEKLVDETIMAIANIIDAKDKDIKGHSKRVAEYSAKIAEKMNMSAEMVKVIYYTGLLHDIGKIGISDAILNKPCELTDEEYEIIKRHTTIGGDILKEITIVNNIADGARYHHEKYDGTGYMEGLKGDEIPLSARIVGVADTYDAMHSDRVYRKGLSDEYILEEFKRCSGKQFDPEITKIAIEILEEKLQKKYKNEIKK